MTRKKKNVKAAFIATNIENIPHISNIAAMTRKEFIKVARVWFGACWNTADKAYYLFVFKKYQKIISNEIARSAELSNELMSRQWREILKNNKPKRR